MVLEQEEKRKLFTSNKYVILMQQKCNKNENKTGKVLQYQQLHETNKKQSFLTFFIPNDIITLTKIMKVREVYDLQK